MPGTRRRQRRATTMPRRRYTRPSRSPPSWDCGRKQSGSQLALPTSRGWRARSSPDRGSLDLEVELLDQRAPLGLFAVNIDGVFLGTAGQRVAAFRVDAL